MTRSNFAVAVGVAWARLCSCPSYIVFLLAIALPNAAEAGSAFYLTAERSFASDERPSIRLDYTIADQPMLVRVLRPKNLESFLDGQLNLSRSYEEPVSELNPGHYFAKGVNAAASPLRLLRNMVNKDFRKSLKGTAFNKAIVNVTQQPLVSVPQQILVAPPSGFQLVKETYLDLQHTVETAHDLGWWFDQNAWEQDRYKIRQLSLDPLPDGVYLVQAVQGKTEAQCLIQVSSLAVQVKQSSEQLLVRVMTRELKPVGGARVSYRDGRGRWVPLPQATDEAGELSFANPEGVLDGKLVVKVESALVRESKHPLAGEEGTVKSAAPNASAVSPKPISASGPNSSTLPSEARFTATTLTITDFLPTQAKDDSVFVVTDRPIFKPGETFYYKGIVRAMDDGRLAIPPFSSSRADVSLLRADGNATGLQGQVELTDFGSFSGHFDLDEAQTPGLYRLVAEVDHKPYGGEFRVRDYVKPTFYLEWLERSPAVTPGQPFKLKFRARRYSGGIPQNVKFEVFLYRKKFEAPQFVTEAGAGLNAGSDYSGQVKSAAPLTQPQRLYSSIEERQAASPDRAGNSWDTAPGLPDSGDAGFEFTVPVGNQDKPDQEWIYSLMVRAQDAAGGQAILTDNLYATLSEAQPALQFTKTLAELGDQDLKLRVQSSYPDGKPAPEASGVIDLSLEQPGSNPHSLVKLPFTTDANGRSELPVPALKSYGRLKAVATLESLGGREFSHVATSAAATLIIAGVGGEAVADSKELELVTASTILSPGEQTKVFALLPKGWGQSESGAIWETMAGSKIFETRSIQAQGRSRWFDVTAKPEYGTGFYHTVTVPLAGGKYREQTLGFRIVPWDKRLQIAVHPESAEAEPLKPTHLRLEVTRADGRPAASAELAVSIVDRAVYAVQAEFRPGIFDFFYPLQRLNLATFYSDDLQGYGYADVLRKPNFALSALKSQSKLAKKAMRDTAGWFPHVMTDAKGQAWVQVDMPANITEWLVTAIAADKEGRLGESTGRFRTVTDIVVDMAGPQFLRDGDETELTVKLANQLVRPVKVDGSVGLMGPLQLLSGDATVNPEMQASGEHIWPLRVMAQSAEGKAGLQVEIKAPAGVRVGGAEEFEIPLQAAVMNQVYAGKQVGGLIRTDVPEDAVIDKIRVQVNSGLLGASLQAADYLVQYPYGCTEQLAHSTVPNLVLMDLLDRAGIKPEQLGRLGETLERARQNAVLGIRKIVRNQKASGGFTLWPGDSEPTLPITLIAMKALKLASELKVEGAEAAYAKGIIWLSGQVGSNSDSATFKGGFVLAGLAEFHELDESPWQQQADFVEQTLNSEVSSLSDRIDALRIVNSYEKLTWHSFNQQFKDTAKLKADVVNHLQRALEQFDPSKLSPSTDDHEIVFEELGFGVGLPTLISAGIGALDAAGALPLDLEAKLKKRLLEMQRNGYWTSTYDTAQVIYNTRQVLIREATNQDQRSGSRKLLAISRDNQQLGRLQPIPGGYFATFTAFGDSVDPTEIRVDGLKPDEVAAATVFAELPYSQVTPKSSGLMVEREFRRITDKSSEPIDITRPLKVGDTIVSEVYVRRPVEKGHAFGQSQFIVIEDGIPSLAEGQEADQTYLADAQIQPKEVSYWSSIKETQRYPDRIERIAKVAPGGEFRLYQVWRIARAGIASIPPAWAFDMYDETIRGNTEAAKVVGAK